MRRGTVHLVLICLMIEGSSHTFASPSEIREGMCIVVNNEVEKKIIKVLTYYILI